jgi:hypothetical protein
MCQLFIYMGYLKIEYVLIDLKKVVISIYFSVKIFIEFEIFLIKIFCFLDKLTYLLLVCTRQRLSFLFPSTRFIVISLHNLNTN